MDDGFEGEEEEEEEEDDDDDDPVWPSSSSSPLSRNSNKIPTQKVKKAASVKTPPRQESLTTGIQRQKKVVVDPLVIRQGGERGRGDRRVRRTPRADAGSEEAREEGPRRSKGGKSATE